jgi:serine/threonine protein phosphatase 1
MSDFVQIHQIHTTPGHPWHVFAIGDIHGMHDKLLDLMERIKEITAGFSKEENANTIIVSLGDLIDRGPDSAKVVEYFRAAPHGFRQVVLAGNHEEMALDDDGEVRLSSIWGNNGGFATGESYHKEYGDSNITPEHLLFLKNLLVATRIGKYLFVHAGINPFQPLKNQTREEMLWIRDKFFREERFPDGVTVVHGHTPVPYDILYPRGQRNKPSEWRPVVTKNRINLDTGACFGGPLSAVHLDSNGRQDIIHTNQ